MKKKRERERKKRERESIRRVKWKSNSAFIAMYIFPNVFIKEFRKGLVIL
jgi:hypothetical protein